MKFDVNYQNLDEELNRPKFYRYSDVKDRLIKVAFDVVRFRESDNIDGLWQIQQTDDGEVIVATYDEGPDEVSKQSSVSHWAARANKVGNAVTLFYKNEPITKIALSQLGIDSGDAGLVCSYLPQKLATDRGIKTKLLNELSDHERQELFTKFPELNE
jgi:hypothetical protein